MDSTIPSVSKKFRRRPPVRAELGIFEKTKTVQSRTKTLDLFDGVSEAVLIC